MLFEHGRGLLGMLPEGIPICGWNRRYESIDISHYEPPFYPIEYVCAHFE
jgi:hypothetical protein